MQARPGHPILEPFLGAALDTFDDRYDYVAYLALDLFGLPDPAPVLDGGARPSRGRKLYRWFFAGLMADAPAFEEATIPAPAPLTPRAWPTFDRIRAIPVFTASTP